MRVLLTLIFVLLSFLSEGALAQNYSNNGNETITDNYTGLTWMQCSVGQTWDGSTCSGTATTHPWDQANALTADYAGYSDWRLPTLQELQSIVDYTTYDPAIDVTSFPGTLPSGYWSSSQSQDPDTTQYALSVFFKNGNHGNANMLYGRYVRLVRGGHFFGSLMDNGDGTVTDKNTELTWMQCSVGQTWDGSTCSGTATTHQWDQATALATDYAGHSDWRLPTLQELQSIVDYTTWYPAIDTTSFPGTLPSGYWSSSLQASNLSIVWVTSFHSGYDLGHDKLGNLYVRLLRGGQVLNLGPTASAGDDQDIDEQTGVTLSGSGSDSDGSIASYSWSQSAGPTVTLNSSSSAAATFTAPAVLIPTDLTFSLTVTDNEGGDGSDSVIITVNPINTLPTASAGSDQDIDEQTGVTLSGSGSDSDGTIASYSWSQSAGPTVTINSSSNVTASFTAPDVSTATTLTFTLIVTDNEGGSGSDSVTITVNPINTLPTASAGNDQDIDEQTGVTLSGSGSDNDGTIVSYSWSQSAGPTVTLNSSSSAIATFTVPAVLISTDLTFSLTVTDNEGGSGSDSVTITVSTLNRVPVGVETTLTTEEESTISGQVSATDPDGGPITYSLASLPSNGTASVSINGSFTYTPTTNFNGADSFTVRAEDERRSYTNLTVSIGVISLNDPPAISSNQKATAQDGASITLTSSQLRATDPEGDNIHYHLTAEPTNGMLTLNGVPVGKGGQFSQEDINQGRVTYNHDSAGTTTDSFSFQLEDELGDVTPGTHIFSFTIEVVNSAPIAVSDNWNTDEDTSINTTLQGSDEDGDTITYELVSGSSLGKIELLDNTTGTVLFTPDSNASGQSSFLYRLFDGVKYSDTARITVTVNPVNDAPVVEESMLSTFRETAMEGTLVASDLDQDSLTFSLGSYPARGIVQLTESSGAFTYTPLAGLDGPDSFTFQVSDGRLTSNLATVTIEVAGDPSLPPVANALSFSLLEDEKLNDQLIGSDSEDDQLSYKIIEPPLHGWVQVTNAGTGSFRYTPHSNYGSSAQFVGS